MTTSISATSARPRLRGVIHAAALMAWLAAAPFVALAAAPGWPRTATTVYLVAIGGLFGVSAAYHVPTWDLRARRALRRADHAVIFLAVAGTYTAVVGVGLAGAWRTVLLAVVWAGATAGIAVALAFIDAARWVHAVPYVALGWVAVAALPALWRALGATVVGLLVLGGALYTAGAVVYARRSPDPAPRVFGYHEVFHALVVAAALAHLLAVLRVLG